MKKWIILVAVLLLALVAWVGSGPYRTWHGMRDAIEQHDAVAFSKHVDFPALRASLKAQLVDEMVRKAGDNVQSSLLGGIALSLGAGLADGVVDLVASPGGIGALMQGREVWRSARDSFATERSGQPGARPLQKAEYHYESMSRFTATVTDADGDPVVFVLRREGLDWKLVDIRLPL